jgi:septation ring formation regulator EzrA
MTTNLLMKVADVLDAVASEKEKLAGELSSLKQEERARKLQPLAEKLSYVGDENLQQKLSSLDDTTLDLISKVAGADVPELGYTVKTAGLNNGSITADSDFASWILS